MADRITYDDKQKAKDSGLPDNKTWKNTNANEVKAVVNSHADELENLTGGVQSVTGDGVNNTDPNNPVLSYPTPTEIGALKSGDNVSELINDVNYLTSITGSNHSQLTLNDGTNPHGTTKSDVGLSNVDNTSDLNKPISTATQTEIDTKTNKALTQTLVSSTPKVIVSTDSDTTFNVFGVGSLCEFTINTGALNVGEAFEINVGDAGGVEIVGGVGVNIFGAITGSTTLGDSILVRRLPDNSFGLTGEVYKVY